MSAPEVAEKEDEEDVEEDVEEEEGAEPEGAEPEAPDDPDVEMVATDVAETGIDPDGFFDDVEAESGGPGGDSSDFLDGTDGEEDEEAETPEAASTRSGGLAEDINNGASRFAVIGLEEEWETDSGKKRSKDDLQSEFKETFEAFRLGHYGSEVVEEYLLVEAEDIHPVWGLVGAMLICAAVVVYKRPDGDQVIEKGKTRFSGVDLSKIKPDSEDE